MDGAQTGASRSRCAQWRASHPLLTREIFDAVIMDAQMPVMSGIEATRRIRAEQDPVLDADVYIIALSAGAFDDQRAAFLDVGANDFLTKPLVLDVLAQAL